MLQGVFFLIGAPLFLSEPPRNSSSLFSLRTINYRPPFDDETPWTLLCPKHTGLKAKSSENDGDSQISCACENFQVGDDSSGEVEFLPGYHVIQSWDIFEAYLSEFTFHYFDQNGSLFARPASCLFGDLYSDVRCGAFFGRHGLITWTTAFNEYLDLIQHRCPGGSESICEQAKVVVILSKALVQMRGFQQDSLGRAAQPDLYQPAIDSLHEELEGLMGAVNWWHFLSPSAPFRRTLLGLFLRLSWILQEALRDDPLASFDPAHAPPLPHPEDVEVMEEGSLMFAQIFLTFSERTKHTRVLDTHILEVFRVGLHYWKTLSDIEEQGGEEEDKKWTALLEALDQANKAPYEPHKTIFSPFPAAPVSSSSAPLAPPSAFLYIVGATLSFLPSPPSSLNLEVLVFVDSADRCLSVCDLSQRPMYDSNLLTILHSVFQKWIVKEGGGGEGGGGEGGGGEGGGEAHCQVLSFFGFSARIVCPLHRLPRDSEVSTFASEPERDYRELSLELLTPSSTSSLAESPSLPLYLKTPRERRAHPLLHLSSSNYAGWNLPPLSFHLPPPPTRKWRVAACSRALFGMDRDATRNALYLWLKWHFFIGIEHFTLYDTDGSIGRSGVMEDKEFGGKLSYFPSFGLQFSDKLGGEVPSSSTILESLSLEHCTWKYRGNAEWVALINTFDQMIFSDLWTSPAAVRASPLASLLLPTWNGDSVERNRLAVVELSQNIMVAEEGEGGEGGGGGSSPPPSSPFSAYVSEIFWGSRDEAMVPKCQVPVVRPDRVQETAVHYAVPRAGWVAGEMERGRLRVNHYADWLRGEGNTMEKAGMQRRGDRGAEWVGSFMRGEV